MPPRSEEDAALVAWLCRRLPKLTEAAERYRWATKLEGAVAAIRDGSPVAETVDAYGLPLDLDGPGTTVGRDVLDPGGPAGLTGLNLDPVPVTGDYRCPATPPQRGCSRRSTSHDDGLEPRCDVYGRTMTLRSGPPQR